jgi:aromatic ring-cleaving dioxygenase
MDGTPTITDWHAHAYFDATSRDAAWALRERVSARFAGAVSIGRFHEKPVGPHPMWSFQVGIPAAQFGVVMPWLVVNRGALDVFVHPNTGDALGDHRDRAVWIGRSHALNLAALG